MKNGQMWKDTDGNDIQAHGGCVLYHEGFWYWYGEHKGADNVPGTTRVDVIGISCYRSRDLLNWSYMGLALPAENDPESPLHPSKVLERPKVLYNEKTKEFVMWAHADDASYCFAGCAVAVSPTPVGPFKLISATQPNKQASRDMTLFRDTDGEVYLFHSKDWNKTMNIARLTEDYTDADGMYVSVLCDQEREAPAVCIHNGTYYMVSSGCTGWDPNSMLYATSSHLLGKWKLIDNPCEGKNYRKTFFGQSTFIFEVGGKQYLMLDHWKPDDLKSSGYSILPITYDDDGAMTITWQDEWNGIE